MKDFEKQKPFTAVESKIKNVDELRLVKDIEEVNSTLREFQSKLKAK